MFGLWSWLFVQTSRHSGPKHFPFPACVCKDIHTCIMTKLKCTVRAGGGEKRLEGAWCQNRWKLKVEAGHIQ